MVFIGKAMMLWIILMMVEMFDRIFVEIFKIVGAQTYQRMI